MRSNAGDAFLVRIPKIEGRIYTRTAGTVIPVGAVGRTAGTVIPGQSSRYATGAYRADYPLGTPGMPCRKNPTEAPPGFSLLGTPGTRSPCIDGPGDGIRAALYFNVLSADFD